MQFNHCDQLNPYADKTDLCSGNVHRMLIQWIEADGYVIDTTKPIDGGTVCDTHMQSFIDLGQRPKFTYTIKKDVIIGDIAPPSTEGQQKPPTKEK
jgi:hypothetical protein